MMDTATVGYEVIVWEVPSVEGEGAAFERREKVIDLFDLWHRLIGAGDDDEREGRYAEALQSRTAWMRANGFEGISQTAVWVLFERMAERVAEIKKKTRSAILAATPETTGSPSGPSGRNDLQAA